MTPLTQINCQSIGLIKDIQPTPTIKLQVDTIRNQLSLFDLSGYDTGCRVNREGKKERKGASPKLRNGKKGIRKKRLPSVGWGACDKGSHANGLTPLTEWDDTPIGRALRDSVLSHVVECPVNFIREDNPPRDAGKYSVTERLLYLLWMGLRDGDRVLFGDAVGALAQYLTTEQFNVLLGECRWHFTVKDIVWLVLYSQDYKRVPLSLLLPCHHQRWGLINLMGDFPYPWVSCQVYPVFYLVLLFLGEYHGQTIK